MEDLHDELVSKDPRRQTAEEKTLTERNNKEAEIQHLVDQITALLAQIKTDLEAKGADDREVTRGEYTSLKTRMGDVKKMIRPSK